ncbi:uncharacterized protein LOC129900937 isoform X1 [Solanum dulcamara]|uniref:uncharacterized protein LOC129900937 isoform X1 n=1 Tax=Solanum dulcamara TaxID=45834 RepID=UPI0024867C77|nr:uncharacterized protein LOC129900937 isoform X1 [Solanum dulcamara]
MLELTRSTQSLPRGDSLKENFGCMDVDGMLKLFHDHVSTYYLKKIIVEDHSSQQKSKDVMTEEEKLLREENELLEDHIATIKKNTKVNEMSMDFTDLPPPHIICGQQRATLNFLYRLLLYLSNSPGSNNLQNYHKSREQAEYIHSCHFAQWLF